jgi:hypothetical protein
MVVVENGSNDDGPAIVRNCEDHRIRLVDSPKIGPGAARNCGLRHSVGDWILFLDADDLLRPDYLEQRIGAAHSGGSADIIAGPWTEFADGHEGQQSLRYPLGSHALPLDVRSAAIAYAPWVLHAALVRRTLITAERSWPEDLDAWPSEDAAFWFPLVHIGVIAWSHSAGAMYRLNTPKSRDASNEGDRRAIGQFKVIEHNLACLRRLGSAPTPEQCLTLFRVYEGVYRACLRSGPGETARFALAEALRWLRCCPDVGVGIRLRRLLGIRLFNFLRWRTV